MPIKPGHAALLTAIAHCDPASAGPEMLAHAAGGGDVEATLERLAELDHMGLINVFESDRGPLVALTESGYQRAAARRQPAERGTWAPRWMTAADLDSFVDERAERPDRLAERAEAAERWAEAGPSVAGPGPDPYPKLAIRQPPRPTQLRGLRVAWPWSGLGACPGCGGRRLEPHEACLLCDGWGLDRQYATRDGEPFRDVG